MTTKAVHTEEELVLSLKKKEEEAFRYLYLHYRGSLFSVINQIIPGKETAGDVLQEVFVAVWKNAGNMMQKKAGSQPV